MAHLGRALGEQRQADTDWHTIAQQLGPDETVWYLDGNEICRQGSYTAGTSDALILDLFVYGKIPPTVSSGSMQIDYVRVYRP